MASRWILLVFGCALGSVMASCGAGSNTQHNDSGVPVHEASVMDGGVMDSGVEEGASDVLTQDSQASDVSTGPSCIPDAAAGVSSALDSSQCAWGQLAVVSLTTISTPDSSPSHLALASSSTGDRFLAVWNDGVWASLQGGGAIWTPNAVWTALVQPVPGDASVSAPIQLSSTGACAVATWTGAGFAVAWSDGMGLELQRLDAMGKPLGQPALVLSRPNQNLCPSSLIDTGSGLAVGWSEGNSTQLENVGLVAANGLLGTPILLGTVGGLAVPANIALAEFQGHTYAAYLPPVDGGLLATTVSEINWSSASATPQAVAPALLQQFFAAGDRLWLSTPGDADGSWTLYEVSPGAPLRVVAQECLGPVNNLLGLAGDACSRLVELGAQAPNPGGFASGFFASSLGPGAVPVMLGRATEGVITGSQSMFGVLWYSRVGPPGPPPDDAPHSGSLSFALLSWQ